MAFGFLGRRKRGPRRDRGGLVAPPGGRVPRDEAAQRQQPVQPAPKPKRAEHDPVDERQDTEARWRVAENSEENTPRPSDTPRRPPVIIRRRSRI